MGDSGKTSGTADVRRRLEAIMREMSGLLAEIDGSPATPGEVAVTDRLLTVHQAAERLGLSASQVYKQAHGWPFTRKLSAKALRFSEAGLERWLSSKGDAATTTPIGAEYPELDEEPARGDVLELAPRKPAA
jgi:predicted DNA-binding transcriptional regulator AlpA